MATQKVVVEGSNVSASQLKDFFRQIHDGSLDGIDIQAILEHRNPWPDITEVTIGVFKNRQAYGKALQKMGCSPGMLVPEIEYAQEPRTIEVEKVTPNDLGFTDAVAYVPLPRSSLACGV